MVQAGLVDDVPITTCVGENLVDVVVVEGGGRPITTRGLEHEYPAGRSLDVYAAAALHLVPREGASVPLSVQDDSIGRERQAAHQKHEDGSSHQPKALDRHRGRSADRFIAVHSA